MSYDYPVNHYYRVLAKKIDKKFDSKGKSYILPLVFRDECQAGAVQYGWMLDRMYDAYVDEHNEVARLQDELELALETVDDMRDALEKIAGCYMIDSAKLLNDSALCAKNAQTIYGYVEGNCDCEEGCCCDNTCKD